MINRRKYLSIVYSTILGFHGITSYSNTIEKNTNKVSTQELLGIKTPPLVGKKYRLRKEAAAAFDQMINAAKKDGIQIYSVSSFRSFKRQKTIWDRKYNDLKKTINNPLSIVYQIVRYSSIPGTSRHHWGTDADLIDLSKKRPKNALLAEHYLKDGIYNDLYVWLNENAAKYEFYEVYTNDPNRGGFEYEPWHWSYAPLSIQFLKEYMEIDLAEELIKAKLQGIDKIPSNFLGLYKQKWGLGINPKLIPELTETAKS
jgi:LAS superfamily LD-carboxypeptidase LdcB